MRGCRGWLILVFLVLTGCPYNDIGAMNDAHEATVTQENKHYEIEDRRYVACDDAPAGATCGLLFDQINPDKYKSSACRLPSESEMTDDCMKSFVSTFYKQLRLRYPLADWGKVESYCRGDAARCISLRDVERAILQTHNANAERQHEHAVAGLEKKHHGEVEDAEDENFLFTAAFASQNAAMMH
ncbi:MAG: hypothetical protein ABI461_03330 [Polyangiaceae bacterium]